MTLYLVECPVLDGFHRPIADNLRRRQAMAQLLAGYNHPLESVLNDLFIGQPASVRPTPARGACANCCRKQPKQQQQQKPQPSTSKSAKCSANASTTDNSATNSANNTPNPCHLKKVFGDQFTALLQQFCPAAEAKVKDDSDKQAENTDGQQPINLDALLSGLLKSLLKTTEAKEEQLFPDIFDLLQFNPIEDKASKSAKQTASNKDESVQQAADKCETNTAPETNQAPDAVRPETEVDSIKREKAFALAAKEPTASSVKHIELDLQKFKPENVQIKVLGDLLLLEAWREEEDEDGLISKLELKREFKLPEQFDLANIQCLFARDGKLKIAIPIKKPKKSSPILLPIRSEIDEPKPVEPKVDEPKPDEPKPVESKPVESKPVEPKPDDSVASAQSDESWEKIAVEPDSAETEKKDEKSSGIELD